MTEEALFIELQKNPPAPPWEAFPGMEPSSLGWRMGGGEDHTYKLYVYFAHCTPEERAAYMARYPEPPGWEGWYSDFDLDGSTRIRRRPIRHASRHWFRRTDLASRW